MSETQDPNSQQPEPGQNPPPQQPVPPIAYHTPGDGEIEMVPEARTMGMLCHLLALAGYVVPFGNIIGPLVIWLIKKDQSPFVDDQGKESLNFQITMMIAALISAALICVVIGVFLLPVVGIVDLIFVIIATVKANQGIRYRYPCCIRLIK